MSRFSLEKWTVKTGQAQDVVDGEKEFQASFEHVVVRKMESLSDSQALAGDISLK